PLVDQVSQWVTYAADVIPRPAREALTVWWIGINDTGDGFSDSTEAAYPCGLQGTYLFINVSPGQREPAHVDNPSAQPLEEQVKLYNAKLTEHVQEFDAKHDRDLTILTFDSCTWLNGILDNASQYGFTNTTGYDDLFPFQLPILDRQEKYPICFVFTSSPTHDRNLTIYGPRSTLRGDGHPRHTHCRFCECTDPTFFWYNTGHPTERVHRLLAQVIEVQLLEASQR
ncbi:hypothetical protein EUX98_g5475, partial [Antrodiella citrinella]